MSTCLPFAALSASLKDCARSMGAGCGTGRRLTGSVIVNGIVAPFWVPGRARANVPVQHTPPGPDRRDRTVPERTGSETRSARARSPVLLLVSPTFPMRLRRSLFVHRLLRAVLPALIVALP